MDKVEIDKKLRNIYYDPIRPESFSGAKNILKYSQDNIKECLNEQETFTKHRMNRKRFMRKIYNVESIDDVWEADWTDLRSISTYNEGYKYILMVIDVLSKYAWAEPLINKTSLSVAQAFQKNLE